MRNAAELAKDLMEAIARDRQSFVSADIRRMLGDVIREAEVAPTPDPHAVSARALIDAERARQDATWGVQNHDPQVWVSILGEEFGELCQAANDMRWPKDGITADPPYIHAMAEAVHTAAVAQAFIECLLRGQWQWPGLPAEIAAATDSLQPKQEVPHA